MSKNQSLIARAEEKIALWKLIEESGGELNETLENWLAEVEKNLSTKVDSYRFALEELENQSERLRSEAQALTNAAKSIERVRDALHERIKIVMLSLNANELNGNNYRFKIVKGANKLVVNPDWLPENFKIVKTTYEIDKPRIKELLEAGEKVPGATLEESHQLRIYVNKGE